MRSIRHFTPQYTVGSDTVTWTGTLRSIFIDESGYLRGKEIKGVRSRTINYFSSGSTSVWRLGDVIHSTPGAVSSPSEGYNAQYRDSSCQNFVNKYRNRRQVVYMGAILDLNRPVPPIRAGLA